MPYTPLFSIISRKYGVFPLDIASKNVSALDPSNINKIYDLREFQIQINLRNGESFHN